mmetsp:Transcript_27005/g.60828  ORF Transcript_27005/g.60828 Transcript_27005/m.60828 type:complete len:516 (+) Transcript_27005:85-1632(+)
MDFDDLDDAQEQAGNILEPEGPISDPPAVAGFKPNPAYGGCGPDGKLKILCFHGLNVNAGVMKMQVNTLFSGESKDLKDIVEYVFVDSPFLSPMHEVPPDHKQLAENMGKGVCRRWFSKDGLSPNEIWSGMPDAIETGIKFLQEHGPVDGMCGFSNGGEVILQLCRLASEGRAELQGMFKFALLMSSRWPKKCIQDEFRPKNVIKIPLFHMCSHEDDSVAFPDFEDVDLRWDPAFRDVVWHNRGHQAARMEAADFKRLRNFINQFHGEDNIGFRPLPPATGDATFDFCGAAKFQRGARLRYPTATAPIRVICFGELETEGDVVFEPLKKEFEKKGISGGVFLEPVDVDLELEDTVVKDRPTPLFRPDHMVGDKVNVAINDWVDQFLEKKYVDDETPLVIVGRGIGAVIALNFARKLMRKDRLVWRLYVIKPPVHFPPGRVKGFLKGCSVTTIVPEHDTGAVYWRYEVATYGEYKVKVLKRKGGGFDTNWFDPKVDFRWASALAEDLNGAFEKEED